MNNGYSLTDRDEAEQANDESCDITDEEDEDEDDGCASFNCQGVLCVFALVVSCGLYVLGMRLPLLEIRTFPRTAIEQVTIKSTLETINTLFAQGYITAGCALSLCSLLIPAGKFAGTAYLIYHRFFRRSADRSRSMRVTILVAIMDAVASYQFVDIFSALLFVSYFTHEGSEASLLVGFYCFSAYCTLSIALFQVVEGESGDKGEIENQQEKEVLFDSAGPLGTRLFPSLPGFKHIVSVDSRQCLFLTCLYHVLLALAWFEPMLDLRTTYQGIAFQRQILSLNSMMSVLIKQVGLPLSVVFSFFAFLLPSIYAFLLVLAGCLDWGKTRDQVKEHDPYLRLLRGAKLLRPWVMTDVLTLACLVFLFSVQGDTVACLIPDGSFTLQGSDNPIWSQFFSGLNIFCGAGVAVFFLRWYWSGTPRKLKQLPSSSGLRLCKSTMEAEHGQGYIPGALHTEVGMSAPREEPALFNADMCNQSQAMRTFFFWIVICGAIHFVPPQLPQFAFSDLDRVLNYTVPFVNRFLANDVPASFGSCRTGGSMPAPTPCNGSGMLYSGSVSGTDVQARWVSGLNSTELLNVTFARDLKTAPVQTVRYKIGVKGVVRKIDLCIHAAVGLINSDSTDNCCGTDRHFEVDIAADCVANAEGISNLRVSALKLDSLDFNPLFDMGGVTGGVDLGVHYDLAPDVARILKQQLSRILVSKFIWWGNRRLTLGDLLNRVLTYNSPHDVFHC